MPRLRYPPAMQPDSESPDIPPADSPGISPRKSMNRLAWAAALVATVLVGAAAVWGVRTFQAESAIAGVERSAANLPLPKPPARTAQGTQAAPATPSPLPSEAMAAAPSGDRLPPLQLPGQRVAPAVLRDLPEWVAAQVGPAAPAAAPAPTSGASGDESAAVAEPPHQAAKPAVRERQPAQYGKSTVFARCPGAGESGAVECRRAICAGAARKSSACAPYRD
jgi:hypothetical protein